MPFPDRPEGSKSGTRVRMVLDAWGDKVSLLKLVEHWCVAVELPIVLRECGKESIVRAERLVDKTALASSEVDPNGRFILRAFDVSDHGMEGQVAIIAYEDEKGEGWCDCWPAQKGLDGKREDDLPSVRSGFTALHGIRVRGYPDYSWRGYGFVEIPEQWFVRADLRAGVQGVKLDRAVPMARAEIFGRHRLSESAQHMYDIFAQAVNETVRLVVHEHFAHSRRAKGECGAVYRGSVLSATPLPNEWAKDYPGTVVTWQDGRQVDISVADLLALDEVALAAWDNDADPELPSQPPMQHPSEAKSSKPIVSWAEIPLFARESVRSKFHKMNLCAVHSHGNLWLLTYSRSRTSPGFERAHPETLSWVAPLSLGDRSGFYFSFFNEPGGYTQVLDSKDRVVQWVRKLCSLAASNASSVETGPVEACWLAASRSWYDLGKLIVKWANDPRVPAPLRPPRDAHGHLLGFNLVRLYGMPTLPKE